MKTIFHDRKTEHKFRKLPIVVLKSIVNINFREIKFREVKNSRNAAYKLSRIRVVAKFREDKLSRIMILMNFREINFREWRNC